MWGTLCAPSTSAGTPCSWAIRMISATGLIVPSTLLTCATLTNLVFAVNSCLNASISSTPSSVIGITLTTIPLRSACSCQGTMLLWCSIVLIITSSPACISCWQKEDATKLMASVVPRVNTISCVLSALMNRRTVSRLSSNISVATTERWCTPRCTLALAV